MNRIGQTKFRKQVVNAGIAAILLAASAIFADLTATSAFTAGKVKVTANFTGREVSANERLVLTLDRPVLPEEGRLAVFINDTDMSAMFIPAATEYVYQPERFPLAIGESRVTVHLIDPTGNWAELESFDLKVVGAPSMSGVPAASEAEPKPTGDRESENGNGTAVQFTPTVNINIKGQNQTLTFPPGSAPERNPYTDVDGQAGLELKVSRRGWSFSSKFDLVGVGFRPNALRFGELQDRAPMVDLSSYLVELGKGRFKLNVGHVSFGSNRHLINSFSSRGVTATIPAGKQNEITLAAMNGTSVVGFDNFLGVSRRDHSVIGAGFAREFFKERPNGLRVEFTVMRGSLLPLNSFNQGVVNDAETSLGFGFRVRGSDTKERFRYEAGISRSRFFNPADELLEQGQAVTPILETWRTARFAELSFDIFQDIALWNGKKLKLTGTYRHEEIQPLFRSIGASTQADKRQHQFEFSGNIGELTFAAGNLRDRDNLGEISSILKTLNRRSNVVVGMPLGSFFTPAKPIRWLPQVSYTLDLTHQFGAFLPSNGEFNDPSQVPDQKNFAQGFNAQWVLSEKIAIGYRFSRAFQDNQQLGRQNADFLSITHGITVGTKPFADLDLDIEVADEAQTGFEQARTDKTFRLGTRLTWRTAFLKNSAFSGGLSASLAGDTGNLNDARNAEFDIQWTYRFAFGKKKFKKLDAQFFIRYSNRYGDTIDRIFFVNALNKTQAFNFGINFNIF